MALLNLTPPYVPRCRTCGDAGYVPIRTGPRAGDCARCPSCTIDLEHDEPEIEDSDAYVDWRCDRADEERASTFAGAREDWGASR